MRQAFLGKRLFVPIIRVWKFRSSPNSDYLLHSRGTNTPFVRVITKTEGIFNITFTPADPIRHLRKQPWNWRKILPAWPGLWIGPWTRWPGTLSGAVR